MTWTRPPPIRGLEVERVSSPALADIFAGAVADGFGVPRGFYWSYAAPGAWDAANVASYIGWLNGEAVATAATVTSGSVAGLYQVTTAPEHRRTGLGEALTRHALLAAAAEGAEEAVLQSTMMGFRLYRRMGFEPAAAYRTWYSREP